MTRNAKRTIQKVKRVLEMVKHMENLKPRVLVE